jgi:hypothetical protein
MKRVVAICIIALTALAGSQSDQGWRPLFNGKDLDGWIPKIKGYDLGDNFGKTFRVEDGVIKVNYDAYNGEFRERFGHLFYRHPFSKYILRLEYRFVGDQIKDGPGWAWRNSGVMIHGQLPKTMRKDQDFPVSAEVQLLGGPDEGVRHTGNLCTPGTNVVMGDKLITQHCTESDSETYRGDQWVTVEIEVHGAGKVIHRINGKSVIEYEQVQLDDRDADGKALIKNGKKLLEGGSISLQSESHPCEFRNIQIRPL